MKLGDAFATVAHPIAVGIDTVLGTNIRNCSACAPGGARREALNDFGDAVFDYFWLQKEKDNDTIRNN